MNHLNLWRFIFAAGLALAASFHPAAADQDGEVRDEVRIVIVPLSDTQRVFERDGRGGYARFSAIVEDERAESDAVLVVHAGNAFSPSLFSTVDSGAHAFDMLNRLNIAILAPGHHEFDFGPAVAARRFAEARFPVVLSNVRTRDGSQLAGTIRRTLIDVAGYRLGFMGLLPRETVTISSPGPLVIEDPVATAATVATELRAEGADVVVALADLDRQDAERIRATGTDIVLAAQGPAESPSLWLDVNAGGLIVRPAEGGSFLPVIDLHLYRIAREVMQADGAAQAGDEDPAEIDPDKFFETATQQVDTRWRADLRIRDTARIEPDRFADAVIAQYYAQFSRQLNEPLATVATTFDTDRSNLRSSANGFAAFVTDAMRTAAGADIALINSGAIRGNRAYAAGDGFRIRDLLAELPFRNRIITLRLTGREVSALLEYGLATAGIGAARFPQVAGMSVRYDPAGADGKRVCAVTVAGKPLDPKATYRLATNEFLARGGDGYDMLKAAEAEDVGDLLQILRRRLTATGKLEPVQDGRLQAGC